MKKNTTKKRPNLMQFTLSEESQKILDYFTKKYGTSKSIMIDRALQFMAGQYHRKIVISYELLTETTTTTTATEHISTKKKLVDHQVKDPDEDPYKELTQDECDEIFRQRMRKNTSLF